MDSDCRDGDGVAGGAAVVVVVAAAADLSGPRGAAGGVENAADAEDAVGSADGGRADAGDCGRGESP